MSENYCPSCGLQKIYGRTLAYYPDGPDLNKNICSKCGQTLMSADATIATLQAQVAQLRAALEELTNRAHASLMTGDMPEGGVNTSMPLAEAMHAAQRVLAQTPTEALARWNAMARVCETARAVHNEVGEPTDGDDISLTWDGAEACRKLGTALAALRSLDTKAGG